MRQIYNSDTIRRVEQRACEGIGALTPGMLLEMKANAFCNQFRRTFGGKQRIVVFSGVNEKGLLALSISGTLESFGNEVIVVLLNPMKEGLPREFKEEKERLMDQNLAIMEVREQFHPPVIGEEDVVIDAIAGEGEMPLVPMYAGVVRYLNGKKATKLSVDISTGLRSEDNGGADGSQMFHADYTFTFYGMRLAFMLPEFEQVVGKVVTLPMHLDSEEPEPSASYFIFDEADMVGVFPPRPTFSHKYHYGKTLLVAGSQGMYGAAVLAARAAVTSGTGHLTTELPSEAEMMLHTAVPESLVGRNCDGKEFDAIAVGPGIGVGSEEEERLHQLMTSSTKPMVLDAGALNILSRHPEWIELVPKGSVLTPHVGEFDRLFGKFESSYERLIFAQEIASERGLVIILKGAYTATVTPHKQVVFNSSGNAGLATAGSGDVLTGILLAFLGKGKNPIEAACVSVFIHGYAADLYRNDFSEECLTASELLRYLPRTFKIFKS